MPNLKVLIVDDHAHKFVRMALADSKVINVQTAADGDEAIDLVQKAYDARQPYDIVFLDSNMPTISGQEVLSYFRANPEYANSAFVMLTAESEQQTGAILHEAMTKFTRLHERVSEPNTELPITRTAYCTPDMRLMFDAIEEFWKDYDLENPNPVVAPFKEKVVEWLLSEAQKRKIYDFGKTRAEHMDSIIRCPSSRRGGNPDRRALVDLLRNSGASVK